MFNADIEQFEKNVYSSASDSTARASRVKKESFRTESGDTPEVARSLPFLPVTTVLDDIELAAEVAAKCRAQSVTATARPLNNYTEGNILRQDTTHPTESARRSSGSCSRR